MLEDSGLEVNPYPVRLHFLEAVFLLPNAQLVATWIGLIIHPVACSIGSVVPSRPQRGLGEQLIHHPQYSVLEGDRGPSQPDPGFKQARPSLKYMPGTHRQSRYSPFGAEVEGLGRSGGGRRCGQHQRMIIGIV